MCAPPVTEAIELRWILMPSKIEDMSLAWTCFPPMIEHMVFMYVFVSLMIVVVNLKCILSSKLQL